MKLPIEEAVDVLEKNLTEILTVAEWAELMGFSCAKYFSREFRNSWNLLPSEIIKHKKIELFKSLIESNPSELNYCIAQEMGLKDEVVLSRYIKRHTGRTPAE
ncbi:MAG: helix-turn-helix transcriptional regulator [Balneolaceae bacterium]|nr:helix-turn-helix transcriptional regulator [Balneolaceae bacterium]